LKKNRQALGAPSSDSHNLTHTNSTATKRSNFVAHKMSILISKNGPILVPPLFVILPLHSHGLATTLTKPIAERKKMDALGMQDFDFAQSDSILHNKTC